MERQKQFKKAQLWIFMKQYTHLNMENIKQIFSEPNTTGKYVLVNVLNDKL